MPPEPAVPPPDRWIRLMEARPLAPALAAAPPPRTIVVDADGQEAALVENGRITFTAPISTSAVGLGGASGSNRTPLGWHRIHARIGAGAESGTEFRSRQPTGRVWRGEPEGADLILTRILTLEGLEPGVNRGAGVDSLERYIYFHGTNHEESLGTPSSHGCIRLANDAIVALFDRVREGDAVLIVSTREPAAHAPAAAAAIPDPRTAGRFHYVGIGGSGMSALAQYQAMLGGGASGSDRAFDRGERSAARAALERLGIAITPQDGSGVAADCAAIVASTAVEDPVADMVAARRLGLTVVHRSELLAHFVDHSRTIAVTGTSGKSTVVAMIFELLAGAGRAPSVITGGDLVALQQRGLWGNAWHGGSDLLVVEADESDGSVVRYHAGVGVVLNLQRDHKEPAVIAQMFERFRDQTREALIVGDDPALEFLGKPAAGAAGVARSVPVEVFGLTDRATVRGVDVELGPEGSRFEVDGVVFRLPAPGEHNVCNALAAIAACRAVGVPLAMLVEPLARFQGVGRRFQVIGRARGVEVVDDFAHNAAKITAALRTAQRRARRVLAVYQPHGYGPTRFLWPDFVAAFSQALRPEDRLLMLEVFYAGGTATRDFSAADIVRDIAAAGAHAEFAPSREALVARIAAETRDGDLVLVMGARDPSLTELARTILAAVAGVEPVVSPAPAREEA